MTLRETPENEKCSLCGTKFSYLKLKKNLALVAAKGKPKIGIRYKQALGFFFFFSCFEIVLLTLRNPFFTISQFCETAAPRTTVNEVAPTTGPLRKLFLLCRNLHPRSYPIILADFCSSFMSWLNCPFHRPFQTTQTISGFMFLYPVDFFSACDRQNKGPLKMSTS